MPHSFKIWNQSNDGKTMAIRAEDVATVDEIARSYTVPSNDGLYTSLSNFVAQLGGATQHLSPYRRTVDVFWNTALGYDGPKYFADKTLESTYTGNMRQGGGYAAQCYVMIDPDGFGILGQFHLVPISVAIIPGEPRDLLVVTV